jgi:hypothetical protein
LVFAARGGGPFQLAYGNSAAKAAAFPIDSLLPGYKTDAEFKVRNGLARGTGYVGRGGTAARADGLQKVDALGNLDSWRFRFGSDGLSLGAASQDNTGGRDG